MMRYVLLGRTTLEVSVLALGCGNFGGVGSAPELFGLGDDEASAVALMDAARENGITLFDTANSYGGGRSEEWVGRWLRSRGARDEVVLTTKVRSPVGPGPGEEGLSARHIREQIEASLRRLGTDHVDLYLAHAPDPLVPIEETLAAFDDLVRAGKVRYTGLSNFTGQELAAAAEAAARAGTTGPVNLQSGYSLLERDAANDAFDVCRRYGIGFTAYSPLAGGWLSGRYRAGQPYHSQARIGMVVRPDRFRDPGGHDTRSSLGSMGCVTRLGHATFEGCGSGGGELDDRFGCGELEFGQQVADGFGQLGALAEHPGGSGEGAHVQALELAADGGPGLVGGRLDDADQQQGQPAQRDVGADAFFQAVVDRSQVDDLFHVPPAAFDFQQLLVADRDVLGGQVRVGAAQQVLAVEVGFDLDRFGVDAQPAGAGDAQVAVEAGFGGDDPTQFRAFGRGQRVRAGDHLVEVGQHAGPGGGVTLGGVGVVADDEPLVVADADFLDPQVVGDVLVAALAGQGGGGLGRAGAQLLADDVVVVAGA